MIALYLAVVPVIVLALYIYKLDKIEAEPKGLLAKAFVLGIVMIIPAIILELMLGMVIDERTMPLLSNMVGIALVEEICKLFVLRVLIWNNKEFDYRFDAIVYAVFVSLGFACFENILYVFRGGIIVAILRALTAIPGHTIFAVFMGYYMGEAKLCAVTGDESGKNKNAFLMILMPTLIHGFYDYTAGSDNPLLSLGFWGFIIVMDVIAFKKVRAASASDLPLFSKAEPEEPQDSDT